MTSLKDKIQDIFPLTPLQKGLLFHSLYEPESGVYFEQLHCQLQGDVSIVAVRQAWQTLVDRHPILRTAIVTKGQTEPVQIVFRNLVFNITEEDWRGLSSIAQKIRLEEFLESDKRQGFVLNRPPLMRVSLIRLEEDRWHLIWSHHHLILDGWSWPILLREFLMLHKAARENINISLPNVRPYGDFIAWLKQKNPQDGEFFWREYMGDFESATPLLMTSKTKVSDTFKGGEINQLLSPENTAFLQKLARNCSVTLNTVIQGAWAILLNRYSRTTDIVYGITVAGRPPELPGVEGMIGPFINTLPFRVLISGEETLESWLQKLQARASLMRQFEHTSLSDIQSWSRVPRGQQMFESLLAFENFPFDNSLKTEDFGLNVPESSFSESTHYPLTLVVVPGEIISLKLSYNAARFDAVTMELLLEQFSNLLLNMANNSQALLHSLSLLGYEEREQKTEKKEQLPITIAEIFTETVKKYPERIALTYDNESLTYQELDRQSNRIARYLQSLGISAEKRVVICLERSPEMIIAMLAVVKAGGVYVPVDPAYPDDRIEFTITDCEAELILTTTNITEKLPDSTIKICLDAENAPYLNVSTEALIIDNIEPDSGAYIIYTSGSTGKPKGVLVTQHNLTRLFKSTEHWFKFNEQDVWTFFHSFAFDFSVWEIWGALFYGGKLVIVPHCVSRDPQRFLQLLQNEQVTVLNQTPSAFAQLLACKDVTVNLSSLRYIIFGGEALNLASLRPWFEHYGENQTRLVNMYGITETTVHVTYRPISKQDVDNSSGSLIGQPIPDLHLYILDSDGNRLPTGVIGEMYVGGAGVARGYLNRPELTAERFVKDHFSSSSCLYRTGDLGRFLPNGDLEYLGRIDNQVKIRGFRIEIGEIETAFSQFPAVQENIVVVATDAETNQKRLIAYLVCTSEQQPTIETLRNHLQQLLPDYMIPSQIVYLDKFPLTANGKIDRKSLPVPEINRENIGIEFVPPATEIEQKIAEIWQQVLGINRVGRFDNYFVLGGDSIRSIRVCSLAQAAGLNLKIEQIFSHPVLLELAEFLETAATVETQVWHQEPFALITDADRENLENIAIDAYPLAQLQAGMLFHGEYSQSSTTYHDVFSFRIRIPFDLQVWEQAYGQMFARHRVLRTAFYLAEFSQPTQVIVKDVPAKVIFADLTNLLPSAQDNYIKTFIDQERVSRFDYKSAPLMRFHIHLLDQNVMEATFSFHHAIIDGWSFANFLAELTGLYLNLMGKGVPILHPQTNLEYSRFIALEQQALQDQKKREFWQQQIANYYQTSAELLSKNPQKNREYLLTPQEIFTNDKNDQLEITPVHEIVTQQAAVNPDSIAVICEGEVWTYQQLNQKANRLARFLQKHGISHEQPVGICLERSLDMVCTMLGVLKAGGCYVPIDPHYPAARIQSMLEDAKVNLLLTRSELKVNYGETICLDIYKEEIETQFTDNLEITVFPDNIAYIIFTSGSTGRPKGVAVSHQALAYHQNWFLENFTVNNHDIVLQKTPFSFDASVWEFWTPLMVGAKLVMAKPGGHQDPAYLVKTIQQENVTLLQLVPSLLEIILGEPKFSQCSSLRLVFSGGEALKKRVWHDFKDNLAIPLINLYGPAETTIDVAVHDCRENENADIIPIGEPVTNTKLYVLNSHLQPVPVGTPGELFVSGYQLARGYWNAPGMTGERFLPDPFVEGERMYRTGDRARYLPDGTIEFLGRADQQVKIRGFRIETAEIVAALEQQTWVNRAVVKAITTPGKPNRLIAYLQLQETITNWQKVLRLELAQILPDYMIPAFLVKIENWPLLPNGKIDINSLPDPEIAETTREEYIAPENETEKILTQLWEQVLQVSRIGVTDNFFELGGDSIIGLQIIAKARDLGFYFTPQDLFNYPQVSDLANHVRKVDNRPANLPTIEQGEIPLTPIQNWFFQQSLAYPEHWNQAILLDIKPQFNIAKFQKAVNQLVTKHPAFRLKFRQSETGWIQELDPNIQGVNLDIVDLTNIPETELSAQLQTIATKFQSQLNLETGTLFRAVYFQTAANTADKLLLIIHHLIVDGVSWRVILQDLAAKVVENMPQSLQKQSVSFPQWSNYLQQTIQSANWEKDVDFWKHQTVDNFTLPLDLPNSLHGDVGDIELANNTENSATQIECNFTKEETDKLLFDIPRTRKARIQEVLLTALLAAVSEWIGKSEIVIALESHGRETTLDISDAVGWFTSLFPCKLAKSNGNILDNLATTKEHLRNLPNNGFSYGILSQKPEYAAILSPIPQGIIFNYLGQFDEQITPDAPFTPAVEDTGISRHPENQRAFQLEITGLIANGKLQMRFGFSKALHQEVTIHNLVNSYQRCLRDLLTASDYQAESWQPRDFPLVNLTQEQLNIAVEGTTDLEDIYPLAPVQEGILFHTNYETDKDIYLQQVTGNIEGNLDVEIFKTAWESCINRHSSLRTSFIWRSLPHPVARVHSSVNLPFIVEDWQNLGVNELESMWTDLLTNDRQQNLSTETAPLMRLTLVRTESQKWRFCWTHHHILLDGWSLPLVFGDVIAFYQAQQSHQVLHLSPTPNYRDFIVWLNQKETHTAEAFWRQELAGLQSATSLGLINQKSTDYQILEATIAPEIYTQLKTYANKNQITVNTLVQAAWGILLSKYSGADEVVFGMTVSGRTTELSGFSEMVGLFINTLPLRLKFDAATPVQKWLKEVGDRILSINEYSYNRLVDIQGWSDVNRGESLFESIVVYENYPVGENLRNHPGDLVINGVESLEKNHYPVSLYALPGEDLTLKIAFQKNIGTVKEREQLLQQLTHILTTFATKSPQYIGEIGLRTSPDQPITHHPLPISTILDLFSQQVSQNPDSPAILQGKKWLTYRELDQKSDQIAQALIQLGVKQETLVAVCLERHAGLVMALLGIIKTGAAYLPLDPAFPSDRLQWILADSQAGVILTESQIAPHIPTSSAQILLLEAIPQDPTVISPPQTPLNLAYTIYTSGSTGRPKGVQIQHQSLVNFLLSFQAKLQLTAADTQVAVTTISFDIAGLELFLPLISGAKLVLADRETTQDGFKLAQLLQQSQATIMQATPTTWRLLLTAGWQPQNDFCALCGGEAMPGELAASLLESKVNLWNVYGPTETTIWSAMKKVEQPEDALSIGQGITNTSLYILDRGLNPLPVGIAGELYIGGMGLARGYRGNPRLTSTTFIPNLFSQQPGERLYRTGDLARWLPNGEIEFLGRLDYQVKIRGYRIELGEIETVLESHPAITQAIVQAIGETFTDQKLVAYLVAKSDNLRGVAIEETPTIETLRLYLSTKLPDYMIPSAWVFLDTMPLTANNKVNRRALPIPTQADAQVDYLAPRNPIEEALVEMWQELLKVEKVGVKDNFFHLGGHSLLAGQFHGRIKKVFAVDLALRELFSTVTIEEIAPLLVERETKSGNTEKIAKAFLRLKRMTPEEKAQLLQAKQQQN
ncbi:non-ribosomal peptide synthetase [Dolichospermum sp. UHCC 0299]|uniref:non-ribosomal peptide synthetase n=1 Tax=Dolichospermum sp. UHCC 0299 TaxID=2590014 RepID=UPI0014451579|nr:non-ribosomal peptide synthetase [Dolichospermum sp. UHCC 0299]MTJ19599.1 amino acid adenylation domain-containing protein [Dolichospermum sp. UHCC 0299]